MLTLPSASPSIRHAKLATDVARLRASLAYDPETGALMWRVARKGIPAGTFAGFIGHRGYVRVRWDGKEWFAHRLIWALVHGFVPSCEIDHENRIKHDNRLTNLRLASRLENVLNSGAASDAVGATYVQRCAASGRPWMAQIQRNGRNRYLGRFATREEACAAYRAAAS